MEWIYCDGRGREVFPENEIFDSVTTFLSSPTPQRIMVRRAAEEAVIEAARAYKLEVEEDFNDQQDIPILLDGICRSVAALDSQEKGGEK